MVLDINIGEFVEFGEGVMAAELTGSVIDNLSIKLGTRPPFIDPGGSGSLDFKALMKAQHLAYVTSKIIDIVEPVRDTDPKVDIIVMSNLGALAMKGRTPDQLSNGIDLAKNLNGRYELAIVKSRVASIV